MAIGIDRMFRKATAAEMGLHGVVWGFIGVIGTVLGVTQKKPFQTHHATMVAVLASACIYAVTLPISIMFDDFAREVTVCVCLLSGYLAFFLLILILVPALGWVFFSLWVLAVLFIAYRLIHGRRHSERPQGNNLTTDPVTIRIPLVDDGQREMENYGQLDNVNVSARRERPTRQRISVYNPNDPEMNRRYDYDVTIAGFFISLQKIEEVKKDGFLIRKFDSCSNSSALIMDNKTGYEDQVYKLSSHFLPDEWIEEQWEKDFYITAIAGDDNGSLLVVMSKGTQFLKQEYKVSGSFPLKWVERKQKEGYCVTSMATAGKVMWAIVMSIGAGFSKQVVEVYSKYPSERIHIWWECGYDVTQMAETAYQVAFVFSERSTNQ